MALKVYRPTSPGRRGMTGATFEEITKDKPEKSLVTSLKKQAGRNNQGKITVRHRGKGAKRSLRIIDFKRDKENISARVASIEYDPNRTTHIALLHYADGEKRYILAPQGLSVGAQVVSGEKSELKPGNALPMSKIPLGMEIHNVELSPGRGGQMARGAGNSAVIMAKEGIYVNLKLPSGEVKRVLDVCYATIGALGNLDLRNARAGKAGRKRHMGGRPHIRGVAHANPSDHPHGGSYKDNGIGMSSPKSPWGWKTRGKKTRSRNRTNKYLVKDRRIK